MLSRMMLALGACLVVADCNQTAQTSSANESQTEADTVSRQVDSLMIGESGASAITSEPPIADPASKTPSAALSDLSPSRSVDTASSARPRPIPPETAPVNKHD
jgi:hypothetical protein